MAKKKKKIKIPIVVLLFVLYIFLAAQPVQLETVLQSQWITSVKTVSAEENAEGMVTQETLTPFILNNRFGYIDGSGSLLFNNEREGYVSLSDSRWAQYERIPEEIEIKSPFNEALFSIAEPEGYPFFLNNRNFIMGKNQNSISSVDDSGTVRWTYDFDAPVTCVDANADYLFTGLLNGKVILLDRGGNNVFSFDALGSRIPVIYACKISDDGSRLAVISGLDEQRFLLFEQYAGSYRVIYHEYTGEGFRRPVMLSFVDGGRRVVFERVEGLGIYDIETRESVTVPLEGSVYAMDSKGIDDRFFVIISLPDGGKNLVSIRYPGTITCRAPFRTESAFMSRNDSALIIGGGDALISFTLEKR